MPLDEPGFSQGFFDQTQPDVPSQPTGTTTDGTELGGDNLVAQPHKVGTYSTRSITYPLFLHELACR